MHIEAVRWQDGAVEIIDQTLLPHEHRVLRITDLETLCEAIRSLRVRGAPAIGVAAAYGMRLVAGKLRARRASRCRGAAKHTAVGGKCPRGDASDGAQLVLGDRARERRGARRSGAGRRHPGGGGGGVRRRARRGPCRLCRDRRTRRGALAAERPYPDALQRRCTRDRRHRNRARDRLRGGRARQGGARVRRRNPAAVAGSAAHRLGTRSRRHPDHDLVRQRRGGVAGSRRDRLCDRRCRSHRTQRRHRQQSRGPCRWRWQRSDSACRSMSRRLPPLSIWHWRRGSRSRSKSAPRTRSRADPAARPRQPVSEYSIRRSTSRRRISSPRSCTRGASSGRPSR